MITHDSDDLVPFEDVKVIRSTAPALLCQVGRKSVWLPRAHISGKLWCTGDRGKLFIRRWVARDRDLIDIPRVAIGSPVASLLLRRRASLHLVPANRIAADAE